MGHPYHYPTRCALCGEIIPVLELQDGEAVEDEDGCFCNEQCRTTFSEQEEEE